MKEEEEEKGKNIQRRKERESPPPPPPPPPPAPPPPPSLPLHPFLFASASTGRFQSRLHSMINRSVPHMTRPSLPGAADRWRPNRPRPFHYISAACFNIYSSDASILRQPLAFDYLFFFVFDIYLFDNRDNKIL